MNFQDILEDLSITATIMIFCLLAGCGKFQPAEPAPGIDPDLKEYVDRFVDVARDHYGQDYDLPEMDIDIGDTSGVIPNRPGYVTVGWCKRGGGKIPRIMINETYWFFYNDWEREQLVFHELGHCALGRMHRDTETPLLIPVSIMSTVMFDYRIYRDNWQYYMNELFEYRDLDFVDKLTPDFENHGGKNTCGGEHDGQH